MHQEVQTESLEIGAQVGESGGPILDKARKGKMTLVDLHARIHEIFSQNGLSEVQVPTTEGPVSIKLQDARSIDQNGGFRGYVFLELNPLEATGEVNEEGQAIHKWRSGIRGSFQIRGFGIEERRLHQITMGRSDGKTTIGGLNEFERNLAKDIIFSSAYAFAENPNAYSSGWVFKESSKMVAKLA